MICGPAAKVKPDAKESTEETKESKTETKQVPAINSNLKMKAAPTSIQLPHPQEKFKLFYTTTSRNKDHGCSGGGHWMTMTPLLAEMHLAKLIWCPPVSSHSAIFV
jgi:hypothetical protein